MRALLAAEHGTSPKPFGSVWPLAFCYANTYHVGMSSLGFQTLVGRINDRPDAMAERFFWDAAHPASMGGLERRRPLAPAELDYAGEMPSLDASGGWPTDPPLSVENQRVLRDFPIAAFSIAFEMDYFHLVDMLARSQIDPWAVRRRDNDPLVVIGGAAVTMNRLPVYDFADVIVHGDGETAVDRLVDVLKDTGPGRARLREALRGEPGFEVTDPREPSDTGYDPRPDLPTGRLSVADDLASYPTHSRILTPHTEFANRALIELSRGCPYKCTFCIMGYQPYNYKFRTPGEIERQARLFLPVTRRVGLVASAVGIHKHIEEICDRLIHLGTEISFSSLRVEDVKPRMIDALLLSGQKTLTIAPEAGNDRLRVRLRKRLSNERILSFAAETLARGVPNLKLYYMVGLAGETDEDVASIAGLTRDLHRVQVDASRALGRVGRLALNIGVFVPKPGTPQRHGGFIGVREGRRRLKLLQSELRTIPNIKASFANPHLAATQTILSCGDRRAADYIHGAWERHRGNWRRANAEYEDLLDAFSGPMAEDPTFGSMAAGELASA